MSFIKQTTKQINESTPKQQPRPKVLRYLFYRWQQAKRVIYAFFPHGLKPNDAWAEQILSDVEYKLYLQMDVRDRYHACAVSERLLHYYSDSSDELLRAAFLHDIGKASTTYNPWERIFVHLYTPNNIPAEPKASGLKGSWQRHLHHDTYGAELIRQSAANDVSSERVAAIVAAHHHPKNDDEATVLKYIDEMF